MCSNEYLDFIKNMLVEKGQRDYETSFVYFFSQVVTLQVNINGCHIREYGLFSF